ncbi:MAG TPA: hypothetical protein VGJ15_04190 [Pirellulales bacterium]
MMETVMNRRSKIIPFAFGIFFVASFGLLVSSAQADDPWVTYTGTSGPGKGKQIVLISGDEEYRSEETLPQLAKILAKQHGFTCTVLFSIDPVTGEINPNELKNIPGLQALDHADLMIVCTRFRDLPDDQMQHIVDYLGTGKPVMGLRTATHAFKIKPDEKFASYSYDSKSPGYEKGFGRQVLGETWVNHHGAHGKESTRGVAAPGMESNPILRGIASGDIWGPTDVYKVNLPLPDGCQPLVLGQVLDGMTADAKPVAGAKNEPMMPIAWIKVPTAAAGSPTPGGSSTAGAIQPKRVFTTTLGASQDLQNEAFRRLLVNACYWCLDMEDQIPAKSSVKLEGDYQPSAFKTNGFAKGVKPADLK